MTAPPWPRSAATSNAHVPWIPPPPVYGLPQGTPPTNEDPNYPYYFRDGQMHQSTVRDLDYYAKVNQALCGCQSWPRPADLPLPATFPLPPTALPSPAWQLPTSISRPPFPNGWFGPQQQQPQETQRATDEDNPGGDSDDGGEEVDEDGASSCSSCSECARLRGSLSLRLPPEERDHRRRSAWPHRTPTQSFSASAPEQPQHRVNSAQRVNRNATATPRGASTTSSTTSSSDASSRLELAATRAEHMLEDIDALYRRLRASYEALQRDPEQFTVPPRSVTPRVRPAAAAAAPTGSPAPRPPQRAIGLQQPQQAPTSAPQVAPQAPPRPPSSSSHPQPSSALRSELLKLESQWKRLEELKNKSYTTHSFSSSSLHEKGAELPSANASSGMVSNSSNGNSTSVSATSFASDQVLQLIRERKAVAGLS